MLLSVGGVGMVGAVGYEAVTPGRSAATVPDDRVAWFTTAMALLTVVAGVVPAVPQGRQRVVGVYSASSPVTGPPPKLPESPAARNDSRLLVKTSLSAS